MSSDQVSSILRCRSQSRVDSLPWLSIGETAGETFQKRNLQPTLLARPSTCGLVDEDVRLGRREGAVSLLLCWRCVGRANEACMDCRTYGERFWSGDLRRLGNACSTIAPLWCGALWLFVLPQELQEPHARAGEETGSPELALRTALCRRLPNLSPVLREFLPHRPLENQAQAWLRFISGSIS